MGRGDAWQKEAGRRAKEGGGEGAVERGGGKLVGQERRKM